MAGRARALIVGGGAGLSAALARSCAGDGMDVVLAARDTQKLAGLVAETGATAVARDATRAEDVERLFAAVDPRGGPLGPVVFNASGRAPGPIIALDSGAVLNALPVPASVRVL